VHPASSKRPIERNDRAVAMLVEVVLPGANGVGGFLVPVRRHDELVVVAAEPRHEEHVQLFDALR
jgi:hypothetical protein